MLMSVETKNFTQARAQIQTKQYLFSKWRGPSEKIGSP